MEHHIKTARPSGADSIVVGYRIKRGSPDCGRDKNGMFHCTCGKCEALGIDINQDCDNCGTTDPTNQKVHAFHKDEKGGEPRGENCT